MVLDELVSGGPELEVEMEVVIEVEVVELAKVEEDSIFDWLLLDEEAMLVVEAVEPMIGD